MEGEKEKCQALCSTSGKQILRYINKLPDCHIYDLRSFGNNAKLFAEKAVSHAPCLLPLTAVLLVQVATPQIR